MKDEHDNLRKKTAGIVYEGQYDSKNVEHGQIYAEKFTSVSLICKVFYGKMKAQ